MPYSVLTTSGMRRRPRSAMRRLVLDVSSILILTGLLLLLDAAITLVWQEPVTAAIGLVARSNLDKRYLSYQTAPLSVIDHDALAGLRSRRERIAFLARREQHQLKTGDAIGTLEIPKIGASYTLIQGTDAGSLEKGPGHYPQTALPGMGRTVAVAGHRTTYLAPFSHIDALRRGDTITLQLPYGTFVYRVSGHVIVGSGDLSVLRPRDHEVLALQACNPRFFATQRYIVYALPVASPA